MGSVHMETRNEGRGIARVGLCAAERTARGQGTFAAAHPGGPGLRRETGRLFHSESGGVSDIAEPILCTYLDLDRLIANSSMTQEQRLVINLLMQGWTETDIAETRGCSRQAVCRLLRDGVQKIVDANNAEWEGFARKRLSIGDPPIPSMCFQGG